MATKSSIMNGVECVSSRLIGNNTVEYRRATGDRVIRLHQTDVVTVRANGDVVLNTGGWKTVTTKDRINAHAPARIHSERGTWYVSQNGITIPFVDGMVLRRGKLPKPTKTAARATTRDTKLAASINAFVRQIRTIEALPVPNNGDCFFCLMFDRDTPKGGKVNDPSHLREHIRENYLHGSLILNALAWAGYANPALIYQMNLRDSIASALRRYLRRQLGLG